MSFAQRVAAIKREARRRRPVDPFSNAMAEITRRVFLPKLAEEIMRPSLLCVMIERDQAGGIWRRGNAGPLKAHEITERSRQYSALRELEGA